MGNDQVNGDLKLSILDLATMHNGDSATQTLQNSTVYTYGVSRCHKSIYCA